MITTARRCLSAKIYLVLTMALIVSLFASGQVASAHDNGSSASNHHEHDDVPDWEFWPGDGDNTWNGYRVYLSPAHHWQGRKFGCSYYNSDGVAVSYIEDSNMFLAALSAADALRQRGYAVRLGRADPDENTIRSNSWGANLHIAMHSNASTSDGTTCSGTRSGTQVYWSSSAGLDLAHKLKNALGPSSPGDDSVIHGGFYELTKTHATAAYVEAAFHDRYEDTIWLTDYASWAWRIAQGVDEHLGFA
jgi:N-acetylmuramoyl-L-alanine amidase